MNEFLKKVRLAFKYFFTTSLGLFTIFKHSFKKRVTLEYPEVKSQLNDKFRGMHALDADKCMACGMCARVCPAGAIKIVKGENGKPCEFNIDLGRCIFCGNCQNACFQKAIVLTKKYELAVSDKKALNLDINTLKTNFSDYIKTREEK